MTSDTEKIRDSSSSDSSGEKMLTEEIHAIAHRIRRGECTATIGATQIVDLFSATIKRLETPVAEARSKALEEAALVALEYSKGPSSRVICDDICSLIRGLKDKP